MTSISEMLQAASDAFAKSGAEGLLIGGMAVNYHGYSRNTQDVDFMVAAAELDVIARALRDFGFTNVERRPNVIFFRRPDVDLRLDVLHVDLETFGQLWSSSIEMAKPSYSFRIPSLEHLLAMKLFALKNSWDRRVAKDLPDVANLAVINNLDLDEVVRPLCQKFADEQIYSRIADEVKKLKGGFS